MFHPYKHGYSVLPQMQKLQGQPIFIVTEDRPEYLQQKQSAWQHQICQVEFDMSTVIYEAIHDWLCQNYPIRIENSTDFASMVLQMQEDVLIHRLDTEKDWLAAGVICFPSGWRPEEKVGKPLERIHEPIPGMDRRNSRKLVEAMIHSGPFERFVWSVMFDRQLNGHPRFPKKDFDVQHPKFWVKVERQITVPFPALQSALFILRHFLLPESELDLVALANALQGMTTEQLEYKGLSESIEPLLQYLQVKINSPDRSDHA